MGILRAFWELATRGTREKPDYEIVNDKCYEIYKLLDRYDIYSAFTGDMRYRFDTQGSIECGIHRFQIYDTKAGSDSVLFDIVYTAYGGNWEEPDWLAWQPVKYDTFSFTRQYPMDENELVAANTIIESLDDVLTSIRTSGFRKD